MKKLNVGLIGAGFMGKAHSLAYVAMPMFFGRLQQFQFVKQLLT